MDNKKGAVGAPTKYKPEYAQQLLDYFGATTEAFVVEYDTQHRPHIVAQAIPTFQRFAWMIGVCRDTLHHWASAKNEHGNPAYPEFSDSYMRARSYQAALITEAGMVGAYPANFAALYMKNFHGWVDKVETDNTHHSKIDMDEINASLEVARAKRDEWKEEAQKRIDEYSN